MRSDIGFKVPAPRDPITFLIGLAFGIALGAGFVLGFLR